MNYSKLNTNVHLFLFVFFFPRLFSFSKLVILHQINRYFQRQMNTAMSFKWKIHIAIYLDSFRFQINQTTWAHQINWHFFYGIKWCFDDDPCKFKRSKDISINGIVFVSRSFLRHRINGSKTKSNLILSMNIVRTIQNIAFESLLMAKLKIAKRIRWNEECEFR